MQDAADLNRYGALASGLTVKQQSMTAASLQGSMSCLAALGSVLTRSVYLLKDTEKIGTYVQLVSECLETLDVVFRVKGNDEFSGFLHLCLFAFDSVSPPMCHISGLRVLQRLRLL